VTGLIVGAEYNPQTTIQGDLAMVMSHVKPIAIEKVMFLNPAVMNAVKTAHTHSSWYEAIARIDPAERISDPPRAYSSAVTELS
jgi:hypothetical protein